MKSSASVIMLLWLLSLSGCGSSPTIPEKAGIYTITDISKGLPTDGLWRENVALIDMDGDGQPDIVTPPPRKAPKEERRPFIFVRDKDGVWKEKKYSFSGGKEYGYGGIAAGDLNGDGYPDMVFAEHSRETVLFMNDGHGGFSVSPLPVEKPFYSRAVELRDINGDGRPDIVELSEASFIEGYEPRGILTAINKDGKGWDIKVFGDDDPRTRISGDSIAAGDIREKGTVDIAIANMTTDVPKKLIWFGDGKGMFKVFDNEFVGNTLPYVVGLGDVDGDGKDEAMFRLAGIGKDATVYLGAFKWTGEAFKDISSGLEKEVPVVFGFADLDGDGKQELVLLSESGLHIYAYSNSVWTEKARVDMTAADVQGARSLQAAQNSDGSWLVVYNLGFEARELHRGIKAFLVRKS